MNGMALTLRRTRNLFVGSGCIAASLSLGCLRSEQGERASYPALSAIAPPRGSSPPKEKDAAAEPPSLVSRSPHVALGVPKWSGTANEVLFDRGEFVFSYDENIHSARWVAWRVTKADIGRVKRKNAFHPDAQLADGFLKIAPQDYARSGFDRGHLCPSGDRTASAERKPCDVFDDNMHPQKHALNAGPWEKLEEETRARLERPDDVAYVVAGGVYAEPMERIGSGVAVPKGSFKVIVWLKDGEGPNDVRPDTPHAAAVMPNVDGIENEPWQKYQSPIRQAEKSVGIDVLTSVPRNVQDSLEIAP